MIEIKQLSKVYFGPTIAQQVLIDINLTINTGEIFGVIGRSGAGKSTLVRCLNLLEQPSSGEIIINGEVLTRLSLQSLRKERQKIGIIFQHFNLLTSRTVFENIALPLELNDTKKHLLKEKVFQLLELVDLIDKQNFYPDQLSGGQKQRVAIARALAADPAVLLSDEATSALDPETTAAILTLLKKINQQLNLTIIIITHEMEVVKAICDRVAVIDHGRIIEQGTVIDIFTQPKNEITKKLTQAALHLELPANIQNKIKTQAFPGA